MTKPPTAWSASGKASLSSLLPLPPPPFSPEAVKKASFLMSKRKRRKQKTSEPILCCYGRTSIWRSSLASLFKAKDRFMGDKAHQKLNVDRTVLLLPFIPSPPSSILPPRVKRSRRPFYSWIRGKRGKDRGPFFRLLLLLLLLAPLWLGARPFFSFHYPFRGGGGRERVQIGHTCPQC